MNDDRFIEIPFIPADDVSLVLIDSRIPNSVKKELMAHGIKWIDVPVLDTLYPSISCHPDIQCHPLGGGKIVVAPNASESLKNQLIQHDFEILIGNTILGSNYPENIAYNVARIGNLAFHNLKYTDPLLKRELEKQGVRLIHVKQGYAKCSVYIIDEHSALTSDPGLAKVMRKSGIDVLEIRPGYISLPGLNYGFIGGAGGLINAYTAAFIGRLKHHPDFEAIREFIRSKRKRIKSFGEICLTDVGSIIPIKEKSSEGTKT